ncbi:MAG: ABC transporter ATP-binding protein [Christensenellales bacterium]|jgi:ATP-binding cassette subfamily B multidrug efflux pump
MRRTLFRLFHYIGRYKRTLLFCVLCAVVSVACTLVAPLVVGRAVDHMADAGRVNFSEITAALILLAVIYLGASLFLWLLTLLSNKVAYRTVNRLRETLFDRLLKLPLSFYDQTAHGDTVSRFVNDVDAVSEGLLQGFVVLLQGVITIVGAILFMLYINAGMTLAVVLSAPASYFVARYITLRSQELFSRQAEHLGQLNGYAQEMIEGQKIVKAFGYEQRALKQFEDINQKLYETGFKAQFISAMSNPSTRIVNNIAYAAIGIIGAVSAIRGNISVGDITSFLIFAIIFAKPFNEITGVLTQMQAAAASAQRVFEILDIEAETPDSAAAKLDDCTGRVQFKDVSFAYRPDQRLIEHFNLDVAPGSRVAIVGRTGAGKTTLVNLLMRFYDVDSGAILIDGIDIRDLPRDNLRGQFGMVLQETWLFNGSIRDNIAYAKPQATMQEVMAAAKDAGAHGFIRRLDNGYDTVISADGEGLSQGQKQLLTIARVMLVNPPMLILDEATSNIDTYTEVRIQRAFARLTKGRTSFVIAHRLSTIRNADMILVMDKGHVVESGTHKQLLDQNGYYARLYNSQFSKETA